VVYFLSQEGAQAKIPEGLELVLVFNRDRKILTQLTDDRQQYLIRDQSDCEGSKRWSPKGSLVCRGQHPCSISELYRQEPSPTLVSLSRRRVKSDEGAAKRRGMSRPLPHTRFMKI
jgi:hypothetical protein